MPTPTRARVPAPAGAAASPPATPRPERPAPLERCLRVAGRPGDTWHALLRPLRLDRLEALALPDDAPYEPAHAPLLRDSRWAAALPGGWRSFDPPDDCSPLALGAWPGDSATPASDAGPPEEGEWRTLCPAPPSPRRAPAFPDRGDGRPSHRRVGGPRPLPAPRRAQPAPAGGDPGRPPAAALAAAPGRPARDGPAPVGGSAGPPGRAARLPRPPRASRPHPRTGPPSARSQPGPFPPGPAVGRSPHRRRRPTLAARPC